MKRLLWSHPGAQARLLRIVVLAGVAAGLVVIAACGNSTTVPDIEGMTTEEAKEVLASEGLLLGEVESRQSETAPGTILSQRPEGGTTVDEGTAVDVVATRGPDPEGPPTVIGLTRAEAEEALRALDMEPIAYEMYSSEQNVGHVVGQVPGPDQNWLLRDRGVLIYVSLGSRAGDVLVPAVIGSQSSDAKQTLVDAGLVPQVFFYENQSDTEGKIVAQLPDPQTPVPAGSDVAIIEIARSAPEGEEIAPE